jgi:hypothetical protein
MIIFRFNNYPFSSLHYQLTKGDLKMTDDLKPLEPRRLENVGDVLEWAFAFLGIQGLVNDDNSCCCDSPTYCEESPLGCYLAKKIPCNRKHCIDHDCENYDEIDEYGFAPAGTVCYRPTTIPKPSAPQWTTETPNEEGYYWAAWEGWLLKLITIIEGDVLDCNEKRCVKALYALESGKPRQLLSDFVAVHTDAVHTGGWKLYWAKIELPPLPRRPEND